MSTKLTVDGNYCCQRMSRMRSATLPVIYPITPSSPMAEDW